MWAQLHTVKLDSLQHQAVFAVAFFCAAQRFLCASAIRFRASGPSVRRTLFFGAAAVVVALARVPVPLLVPAISARACCKRAISASIVDNKFSMLMRISVNDAMV